MRRACQGQLHDPLQWPRVPREDEPFAGFGLFAPDLAGKEGGLILFFLICDLVFLASECRKMAAFQTELAKMAEKADAL